MSPEQIDTLANGNADKLTMREASTLLATRWDALLAWRDFAQALLGVDANDHGWLRAELASQWEKRGACHSSNSNSVPEGCTPEDARVLRKANGELAALAHHYREALDQAQEVLRQGNIGPARDIIWNGRHPPPDVALPVHERNSCDPSNNCDGWQAASALNSDVTRFAQALENARDGFINLRPDSGPMYAQMTKHVVAIDAVLRGGTPHTRNSTEPCTHPQSVMPLRDGIERCRRCPMIRQWADDVASDWMLPAQVESRGNCGK